MTELRLLLVEDDPLFAQLVSDHLRGDGIAVTIAADLATARRAIAQTVFDVLVLDNHLPDGHGLELLDDLAPDGPRALMVTARPAIDNAIEALRRGIEDYLTKPVDLEQLRLAVLRGVRHRRLERLDAARRRSSPSADDLERDLIGDALEPLRRTIVRVAPAPAPVLIQGETGTGKSLLARLVHAHSGRDGAFLKLNCGALPRELIEAELFGTERGAFTGATTRPGLFELAHGGTLFLDEIAELEPGAQAKLLGVLDDGCVRRIGSGRERRVDVRIVAATHVDLETRIDAGDARFRADLFYRLGVVRLTVPPLRARLGDLAALMQHLLATSASARSADGSPALAPDQLLRLRAYPWPGNVRELRNVLDRALLLHEPTVLRPADLLGPEIVVPAPTDVGDGSPPAPSASSEPLLTLAEIEQRHILRALERCDGQRQRTADALGIGVATLRRKLRAYGVPPQ
ncbi:MAG: sigma-54 dependent transcriptional regulator [Acidobacteriota bacterium]